jgi:predicted phage-related endonuclease
MKIQKFDNKEDWLDARLGRVTGTRLKDLIVKRGTKPKIGFYEIIAERIAIPANLENVMDRGIRLEDEALERFAKETKKKVNTDLVLWYRDDDENIAVSPDGYVGKTEAIECKCLSSARHLEAYLTKEVPGEYEMQALQYFIVNEKLKTLYFVFYDPRMPKDFFWLEIQRDQEKVEEYLGLEREVLAQIASIEKELTF